MENINQRTHHACQKPGSKSRCKKQARSHARAAPAARMRPYGQQSTRGMSAASIYYSLDASGVELGCGRPVDYFGWRLVSGVLVMAMLVS
jgi:hypothetical protein